MKISDAVGGAGVGVGTGVGVGVGVGVAVGSGVDVGCSVGVRVTVGTGEDVGVSVGASSRWAQAVPSVTSTTTSPRMRSRIGAVCHLLANAHYNILKSQDRHELYLPERGEGAGSLYSNLFSGSPIVS